MANEILKKCENGFDNSIDINWEKRKKKYDQIKMSVLIYERNTKTSYL